jgi:adenine-specific DNA-methyltransferase
VDAHTRRRFGDLGRVPVGVKTTADRVFVRSDWNALPAEDRPELLRPLTTRHRARRFKPLEEVSPRCILYPHERTASGRAAVDLARYPRSARYLESHRSELEARAYVTAAGRRWYEIWVPQDPASWSDTKLVFLDIAAEPTFWIDAQGTIVSGECYWLRCEKGADPELLWLALAVANSSFIEAYYDHRFPNRLYAGRRRFIAQYVEHFPLPDLDERSSRSMIARAKEIYVMTPSVEAEAASRELDAMVWRAFGLRRETRSPSV